MNIIRLNKVYKYHDIVIWKRSNYMKKKILPLAFLILSLSGLVLPAPAFPLEIVPFDSFNQSPLISIYGLPGNGNFLLLPAGATEVGMNAALSNNFATNENQREQIILDGETTRFTLTVRHAFSQGLEFGIKVPYIVQGGGFMDNFIEEYHSTFGMPQGDRLQAPRNRLLYWYRNNGIDKILVNSSGAGFGDIQVTTALQLYEDKKVGRGLSLNFDIKLPTGDSHQLMGSGSTDFSLWLTGGTDLGTAAGKWTTYGAAGLLYMTDGDVLPDQQKSWVSFGSLGLGWIPLSWLALKVQTDAHTVFYNHTDLRQMGTNSVQFIAGGTATLWGGSTLDISMGEDLVSSTSPDVVFYLNLRQRF
jgi:hypothetical protein